MGRLDGAMAQRNQRATGGVTTQVGWPSLAAARRRDDAARVEFRIDGVPVGSVDRRHLDALSRWPRALRLDEHGVTLLLPVAQRNAGWAQINVALRVQGLIIAWRDEPYPVIDPAGGQTLAVIERAASRFWGTLTFGAHCNGYVADARGRPTRLWMARRSASKATDPGLFDNLVGGGVPFGQTPEETLLREGFEEAGLSEAQMRGARPGRVIELRRDIAEGLQYERLHVFDLALPADAQPVNQDGEVAELHCLPIADALALASGDTMTVDASLVTLDFALRQGLIADDSLERALRALVL
jgi:8-oxo-dGTP pyrophosphatase MutT (NUDIX family)